MRQGTPDRAESIRHRLRNRVRARGEDVQYALQRYAIERFLYRLGRSPHRDRFILKGAMLFELWGGSVYRPTRDLDLTGYGSSDPNSIIGALREVCDAVTDDGGIEFDTAKFEGEPIREETEYRGLRLRFQARLGDSRIPMQIDIGVGDAIEPPPLDVEYPTLLDDPPPTIRAYPQEAVIAEKLHAMAVLDERNSRYKDFYDLYVLAVHFPFDGARLAGAIVATFEHRRTAIEAELPVVLTPRFFADEGRAGLWRGYVKRNDLRGAPEDFGLVGQRLLMFIVPIWTTLADGRTFSRAWPPAGPWTPPGLDREAVS